MSTESQVVKQNVSEVISLLKTACDGLTYFTRTALASALVPLCSELYEANAVASHYLQQLYSIKSLETPN